jgi:NTP pyrophosphatase (non-canonical NTP hydrolase)
MKKKSKGSQRVQRDSAEAIRLRKAAVAWAKNAPREPRDLEDTHGAEIDAELLDAALAYAALVRGPSTSLNFDALRVADVKRAEDTYFPLHAWTALEWAGAAAGELGEAANKTKKMRRAEVVGRKSPVTIKDIGDELGDTVLQVDLWAARLGINLGAAVTRAFNAKSRELGSNVFLDAAFEKEGA